MMSPSQKAGPLSGCVYPLQIIGMARCVSWAGSLTERDDMTAKHEALEQIVMIARAHGLTPADIRTAFEKAKPGGEQLSGSLLGRILGYLGGTFIFAGLGVFIALNWDVMNSAARIIITLGSGITVFIMAIVASADERYAKVRTPLYLIAAALQPGRFTGRD